MAEPPAGRDAASTPSSRSSNPPWPGMSLLESLTPKWRLASDSARSPSCATTATPALTRARTPPEPPPSRAAIRPASAALATPPTKPAQVLLGLRRGASPGGDSRGRPTPTAGSATGAITRAERIRSRSELSLASARSNGGAVATFAAVIVAQRFLEIGLAEIGPQRRGEDELGIRRLPQQEIADALLAAGADDEIGIRHVRSEQVTREQALVDRFGREPPGLDRLGDGARGAGDLGATAIGERDGQPQPGIVVGQRLGIVDDRDDIRRQALALADHAHTNA